MIIGGIWGATDEVERAIVGFNGAADDHRRNLLPGRFEHVRVRVGEASMEPPMIIGGIVAAPSCAAAASELQWSRR